mgnify:CR=1 FL=1
MVCHKDHVKPIETQIARIGVDETIRGAMSGSSLEPSASICSRRRCGKYDMIRHHALIKRLSFEQPPYKVQYQVLKEISFLGSGVEEEIASIATLQPVRDLNIQITVLFTNIQEHGISVLWTMKINS